MPTCLNCSRLSAAVLATLLIAGFGPSEASADDDQAENLASVRASIDRAIELLEAEDYEGYIEEFYSVEEYERLQRGRRLTDEARHLGALPRFQEQMLAALRIARDSEPRWTDGDGVAQFTINLTAHAHPETEEPAANATQAAAPDVAGWGDDLDQVLASALEALNEEDYHTFVERLFPAPEVVEMQSSDGMDLLLLKLETYPEMVEAMQRDLEQCQSVGGQIDGNVAEFTLTEGRQNPQTVRFQLVGGNWRFFDSITPVREEAAVLAAQSGADGDEIIVIELEQIGDEWRFAPSEEEPPSF